MAISTFPLCPALHRARLGLFHGPARVAILLRELLRPVLPVFGNASFLDRFLLILGVALPQHRNYRGVDDLPRHSHIASRLQMHVKAREQLFDRAGLGQLLAKQPYRLGVRNRVLKFESEKAYEGEAGADLNSVASPDRV